MKMSELYYSKPGPERQEKIVNWIMFLSEGKGLPVNNRYQLIIEKDKDLQILLKKGRLKRKRVISPLRSKTGAGKHQTYLVLP